MGGGQGVIARYLCDTLSAAEGYVVDGNPAYLAQAKELGLNTLHHDIEHEDLPYENGFFDAVFCGEIIEHMWDTDRFLEQIERVLAPGGCLVLTTPNLASWFNRLALAVGWQPLDTDVSTKYSPGRPNFLYSSSYSGKGHISNFTYRALKELLKLHGFTRINAVWKPTTDLWEVNKGQTTQMGLKRLLWLTFHATNHVFGRLPGMSQNLIVVCSRE
jgi:SAM-dependent methyltransferase